MTQNEGGKPPRPNQRRSRRQCAKGSTKIRAFRNALGLGPNIGLAILDLSETGLRMTLKEALPQGQEFEVNIESPGGKIVKMLADVVWCVPAADGTFVVGAHFQKNLAYLDLQNLARN